MRSSSLKMAAFVLFGMATASPALQIQYDVAGPIAPFWRSHIVQVSQDFGSWGVSVAPEWIHRDYHYESWSNDTTEAIHANGGGVWVAAFWRPFDSSKLSGFKLGTYFRARRFDYSLTSRDDGSDFQQEISSYAIGGESSWEFHPSGHIVIEPYLRLGVGYYDMHWTGNAPEYPHPSEFRYTWDPDVRTGLFVGYKF